MADRPPHVLILGAGINGAALARELLLNGVNVTVVDTDDLASGATAFSSRLIHGGLRYLEYGEFDLVRESLAERTRLLKLAPQFVRPLRLFIPVAGRWGGLAPTLRRFLGREHGGLGTRAARRGLWLVRAGLRLYDAYARDPSLPRHEVHRRTTPCVPGVERREFRWFCAYWDAQILYPERLVVALFEDARRLAAESSLTFEVLTYHEARVVAERVEVSPIDQPGNVVKSFVPSATVNATGAWVDLTLQRLQVASTPLIGGTKGSHVFTLHPGLKAALAGDGLYAEATDGRPVFVLPFGAGTLIGTTDERYHGDPRDAIATAREVCYLLETVNRLVPGVKLAPTDVTLHYCGVRPLPAVPAGSTAAITRRHRLESHSGAPWPLYSIIGGKLTTCRSLADKAAGAILRQLGHAPRDNSQSRLVPGAADFPRDESDRRRLFQTWAAETGLSSAQIQAVFRLMGMDITHYFRERPDRTSESLPGADVPIDFARWIIAREWVTRLEDLVERRLMLLYEPGLAMSTLETLADLLVAANRLQPADRTDSITRTAARLALRYGRELCEKPLVSESK